MDMEPSLGKPEEAFLTHVQRTLRFGCDEATNDHLDSVEVEDGDGNVFRVDMVDKVFNSQLTKVFEGSNLDEIIDKMFVHMRMQVENPALANSRFVFNQVLFLDVSFH